MRRMWAVVTLKGELEVVEVEGESRKEIEYTLINCYDDIRLMMTEAQILRFRNMSVYEFVKKYGKKGWNMRIYEELQGVKL